MVTQQTFNDRTARIVLPIVLSSVSVLGLWWLFPLSRGIISNVTQIILALVAASICIVTARNHRYPRVWFLIGFGILLWLFGQTLWTIIGSPPVSIADIPFIGGLVCIALGILIRPLPTRSRYQMITSSLELLIAALSLLAFVSFMIFGPLFHTQSGVNLEILVQLAYPVADLCILVGAFRIASHQSSFDRGSPWKYLIFAAMFFALTDLLYAYFCQHDMYAPGSVIDFGWMIGLALFGVAAYLARQPLRDVSTPIYVQRWIILNPYLPLVVLGILFFYNMITFNPLDPMSVAAHRQLLIFVMMIGGIVVVRQGFTLYENQQLNSQLKQRTITLAEQNRALDEARSHAEAANNAKNAFLATMSHELRTPLSVIIGTLQYVQFDLAEGIDPEIVDMLARAESSSQQLVAMIDEILDFSKASSGKMIIKYESIELQPLLKSIQDGFKVLGEGKGIAVNFLYDEDLPPLVETDPIRVRQIVMNLVSNAIKFTHKGSVTLSAFRADAYSYSIQVRDTGIGIPDDKKDTVWEAFMQADTSPTRIYGGTGLGLAIVKQLVTALNGTISTESIVDQGTTITVTLPLSRQPKGATPEPPTLNHRTAIATQA